MLARRFANLFTEQDKVIINLLDHCTEGGLLVFDFMPTSPASRLVDGLDTLMYGVRHVRNNPKELCEVDLSRTVRVDDLEVPINEADEQRAHEES